MAKHIETVRSGAADRALQREYEEACLNRPFIFMDNPAVVRPRFFGDNWSMFLNRWGLLLTIMSFAALVMFISFIESFAPSIIIR